MTDVAAEEHLVAAAEELLQTNRPVYILQNPSFHTAAEADALMAPAAASAARQEGLRSLRSPSSSCR